MLPKDLVEGKTAEELQNILSLPRKPTHIVDVKILAGTTLQKGIPAGNKFGLGGYFQYYIKMDPKNLPKNWFVNGRPL